MHRLPFSDRRFDRGELEREQLASLNALIARARENSSFHRDRLPDGGLCSLDEIVSIPFMDSNDLLDQGNVLLVSAEKVARMVSLPTSGTSGPPKRIAFSEDDVRQTSGFFESGLRCVCRAGESTAVLFPASTPGGMGSLICGSVEGIGATAVPIDPMRSLGELGAQLSASGATSAVGSGRTLLALARFTSAHGIPLSLERVLISSDNAADSMVAAIEEAFGCEVFEHYGMTETGFGCAVDCHAHAGMHVREFDLLVEIVDPDTGEVLPAGEEGEVVITTLRREAMPVIRYRTGDIARIVSGTCPCGGSLLRIDGVRGHALSDEDGLWETEAALDEVLFALPGIIDYRALIVGDRGDRLLVITVDSCLDGDAEDYAVDVEEELAGILGLSSRVEMKLSLVGPDACLKNPKLSRLACARSVGL